MTITKNGFNIIKTENKNLEQIIADYCSAEKLPKWHTVEELLEFHYASNNALQLTYKQKEQLYKFKEQLEKIY